MVIHILKLVKTQLSVQDSIQIISKLASFSYNLQPQLTEELLRLFKKCSAKLEPKSLIQFLKLIGHYEELKIDQKQARAMAHQIYAFLLAKNLNDFSQFDVYIVSTIFLEHRQKCTRNL